MNCDGGDVKRVESATNAHLGDAPSLPRGASRHFPAPGTPISNGVRLTVNSSGKEYRDKNNRSVSLTLAQLIASSREEIARLVGILRESRRGAVIRGGDGSVLPGVAAELVNRAKLDEEVSVPIRDPQGTPLASLDVLSSETVDSTRPKYRFSR
jgi:hypothetical protein